jgi:hypothetical protein
MALPRLQAPIVTAALLVLAAIAVLSWGRGAGAPEVAHVPRTRANLYDGACVFAADVELRGRLGGFTFGRHDLEIRDALVDLLRTKPAYMVRTPIARESLRVQMLDTVNRVAGRAIATRLRLTEFILL